jgi:LmbE family N-acetylglucosaminyl deacetylase
MPARALSQLTALLAILIAFPTGSPRADASSSERGAVAAWEKILKLQTVASIMQTTAHPDDEQGELLAFLGRGKGVRTALLTLTRGEAGDNAIGPELFDALGLIRTDELALAGKYYGLDEQYFTSAADYGFSKRADEALAKWDRQALLADMVRAIRASRPLVVVSRWQGTPNDGHGQHQAAGLLTPEAVAAAADSRAFPELGRQGLRPWRVRKVYSGGWREADDWQVAVDPGVYDPLLGDSFTNVARKGLSFQRSQTSGRFLRSFGTTLLYYRRAGATTTREADLFDGLDTSLESMYRLFERPEPQGAASLLRRIAEEAVAAMSAFEFTGPSVASPALARGLAATREALLATTDEDVAFVLRLKERQFEDALTATLGLELDAVAEPADTTPASAPYANFEPPATLPPLTGGQSIDVAVTFANHSGADVAVEDVTVDGVAGTRKVPLTRDSGRVTVRIPPDAPITKPYFWRLGIAETRYTLDPGSHPGPPWGPTALHASARYRYAGVTASISAPVMRRESNLPDGYETYDVEILPPVSLRVAPAIAILRAADSTKAARLDVDLTSFASDGARGKVRVEAPAGWTVSPSAVDVMLRSMADRQRLSFTITAPSGAAGAAPVLAVFATAEHEWRLDYTALRHRDLPVRYFVKNAAARVAVLDLQADRGVRVGYVMGIGDEVPAALQRLGAQVTLLTSDDLAAGDLARFDTIVTGTRAYAVRDDLRRHNRRLLDWVSGGGNLIVLYNTPEFDPRQFAPYPAELPQDAEEVSEEDAPVALVAPQNPLLAQPNRITAADFDGWIEQRGSKFFSTWDEHYAVLAESHDRGQPPQRGGWLTTSFGKGRWTYMAYALHRQVPYAVPGAYRILANLIARR